MRSWHDAEYAFHDNGQDWNLTWHLPPDPPGGRPHGSAGICVTPTGEIVLVSQCKERWEIPAGRPEVGEDWRATLDREVMEEACAKVIGASLLGFSRGECVNGHEQGLVLVRAIWRADIELLPWEPLHEMKSRLLVDPADALAQMVIPAGLVPLNRHLIEVALAISRG